MKTSRRRITPPVVVYHVAGMGDWKSVVEEQLQMLQSVGLTRDIHITYLGDGLDWLIDRLDVYDLEYKIARSDPNLDHCETFAMIEIERLANEGDGDRPILYMHTKGVSNPGNAAKRDWRHLMEAWVVRRWQVNMAYLGTYDAVGVNWIQGGPQHFSGTFWMANPGWIRRLPRFEDYHRESGMHRYTCELWIGAAQWCNALSLGCKDEPFWNFGYDYLRWLPKSMMVPPRDAAPLRPDSPFGDVFTYFNTDKDIDHSYGPVYETLFPPGSRDGVRNVLEVGVLNGRSLQAWEAAFPNAAVYGTDTNAQVDAIGQRTTFAVCNSTKPRFVWQTLDKWGVKPGHFDLIVDDGSHVFRDQLATATLLRPYLAEDGVYVIEDVYPAHGADPLAAAVGGVVLDRRGVKNRFDDTLVIAGRHAAVLSHLRHAPASDIPTPFPTDDV